jgi:hypothetical protein
MQKLAWLIFIVLPHFLGEDNPCKLGLALTPLDMARSDIAD